ncbi:MAG: fibronectin type III domain-containing protein [Burkholderiaceae bacterium]
MPVQAVAPGTAQRAVTAAVTAAVRPAVACSSGGSGGGAQGPVVRSADSQILLEWPVDSGADTYNVYYDTVTPLDKNSATLLNASVGLITGNSTIVPGLDNGTTYYAWVAPVTSGTEGAPVSLGEATPRPGDWASWPSRSSRR